MPTYEYTCPQGHDFELFQKMSDKPRAKCPVCGRLAVRKISGGAGLHFKGSGFYITDYGKDGKGPRKDAAAETGAAAKAGDNGKAGDPSKAASADKAGETSKAGKADKAGEPGQAGSTGKTPARKAKSE